MKQLVMSGSDNKTPTTRVGPPYDASHSGVLNWTQAGEQGLDYGALRP